MRLTTLDLGEVYPLSRGAKSEPLSWLLQACFHSLSIPLTAWSSGRLAASFARIQEVIRT